MPRKDRTSVVFDTNVLLRFFLNRRPSSPNARVVRLWIIDRQLQIIVSPDIRSEYVRALERKNISAERIRRFEQWLRLPTVTHVRSGGRRSVSRDPKDDMFLDAAEVGRAAYVVTNDRDLLDIPAADLRSLRFGIVKPIELLDALEA